MNSRRLSFTDFLDILSEKLGLDLRGSSRQARPVRDLGFDSIMAVELHVVVEEIGRQAVRSGGAETTLGELYDVM